MKKFTLITAGLLAALIAAVPAFAADPVTECMIPEKAAVVDGVISAGEWDAATKLVLNISDTSTWSESGAGIVGTQGWLDLGHTDADFSNELAFMVDDTYVYILCTRTDSTLNFATDNFRTPYASDCSLMWFYDTEEMGQYGLQLLCADKSGVPHIGYFFTDAEQQNAVDLVAEGLAEAKTVITDNGYIMEAKVAFEGMDDFTLEMLKSGSVTVSYCSVNICEEGWDSDDGAHALWGTYNYQAQYIGVNEWFSAPAAVITEAPAEPANGIIEATEGFANEGAENLLDGDETTKWCMNAAAPVYAIWKTDAVTATGYEIVTANDNAANPGRNPGSWVLYGSNDGAAWTAIDTVEADNILQDVDFTTFIFAIDAPAEYSYYKFEATSIVGGGVMQISGINLLTGDVTPSEAPAPVVEEVAEEPVAEEVVEEAAEEPAAEEVVEEVVEAPAAEEVAEAPQTFDFGVIAAAAALVSLAGYAVTKKR
ncbi:MAG: hypothetical protein IJP32_12120 [Clostridia bacterium]|nr:hypothetical protein [Clostridia bacterium]MBQ9997113.1 hypothetical protein [Clostridia bacterium]